MTKLFRTLILCASLLASQAISYASNVTGTITSPNTAVVLQNATLSFSLNQAAIVAGSFSVAPTSVSCYTSTDGTLKGLPNPLVAPTVVAANLGGTLSGTYYVKILYYEASGGTISLPSSAYTVAVSGANNALTVSAPTVQPTNATGYKVYVGTTLGSEKLQATTASWSSTNVTTYNSSGAAVPSSNTSVCSIAFNDTFVPTFTKYRVNLLDVNGTQVPGFPQDWYLSGSSVDITNVYPLANVNQQTRFPYPILANPSSNAQQSVNSPLTLNSYALTAGSLVLPDNASPSACAASKSIVYSDSTTHKLMACQNGGSATAILDALTNGWTYSSPTIRATTATDRVVVGFASVGDFSVSGYNGSIIANQFLYAASAATNASIAVLGYDVSGAVVVVGAGTSGSGTMVPFTVKTNNTERSRWLTDGSFLHGFTTSDVATAEPGAIVSSHGIYVASAATNASAGGLLYDSSSTTVRLVSGISGSGTVRPLAFVLYDDLATSYKEAARFEKAADLAGTARIYNLELGGNVTSTYNTPLYIQRNHNTGTHALITNSNTDTLASVGFRAYADNATGSDVYVGTTGSGFTTANGVPANTSFVIANAASTGLMLQAADAADTVKTLIAAVTEVTVASTGVTLNHALPVTSGGTGNTSAWTSTGVLYASSTSVTATDADFTFDSSINSLVVQQGLYPSGTRANPSASVNYLQTWFDAGSTRGAILAYNYGTAAYKDMYFGGLTFVFDANGTNAFGVTATGPKFYAGSTAGSTASFTNCPAITCTNPYTWVRAVSLDGSTVYIPAFK